MLVASLMSWRAELFGAARARELADALASSFASIIGASAAGGRNPLEDLLRQKVVLPLADLPPDRLAPVARAVTAARLPIDLIDFSPVAVLAGLGADPKVMASTGKAFGVDGLAAVPVTVAAANPRSAAQDKVAMAALRRTLDMRLGQLMLSTLKATVAAPKAADQKRRRGADALDKLIAEAQPGD
jgi:hypothetical protein